MAAKRPNMLNRTGVLAFGDHLRHEAREVFARTATGRLYLGPIEEELRALERLPAEEAAPGPDPLAEAVTAHGDLGRAIWFALATVAASPDFAPEVRAAATRVREAFGPRAPSTRARAAHRVERAAVVRRAMAGLADELARLPPAPGGGTIAEWIERWCEAGSGFGANLVGRRVADLERAPAPAALSLGSLVGRCNGLILRARAALRDEMAYDPAIPRTAETEVFGLFDGLLAEHRLRADVRARRSAVVSDPAAPAPAPSDPAPAPSDPA
jgi:hypothetical protein